MKALRAGFTLIELLIVVAIIGILAAIAIPNFLEAQTRAKVSRAKSDLRNTATSIEAYFIDYDSYPFDNNDTPGYPALNGDGATPGMQYRHAPASAEGIIERAAVSWKALYPLSTPIEFISTVSGDAFMNLAPFSYDSHKNSFGLNFIPGFILASMGPDEVIGDWNESAAHFPSKGQWYDPTNGTVSAGDLWRAHDERSRWVKSPENE